MNKKIGFILALVFVALLVMGTASAGLFDFYNSIQTKNRWDEKKLIHLLKKELCRNPLLKYLYGSVNIV